MIKSLSFIFLLVLPSSLLAQRGHYAGTRTQGYKDRYVAQTDEELANRFQTTDTGTTQRLPVNAHGDRGLVDRIAQMPRENQPFWYINANILEAQRQSPFPIVQGQSMQQAQGQLSTQGGQVQQQNLQGQGQVQAQNAGQNFQGQGQVQQTQENQGQGVQTQLTGGNLNNRANDFGSGFQNHHHHGRAPFAGSGHFSH